MSTQDLVFQTGAVLSTIFDPLVLESQPITVSVSNLGADDLSDLGLYLVATTNLGDVDYPADYPPETDYQDLLAMGSATDAGLTVDGGLEVTVNGETYRITRSRGASYATRIAFPDLNSGDTEEFILELTLPPAFVARRFFVNVVLE